MKGITVFALMIVGVVVLAGVGLGLTCSKYNEISTTVIIEDGITCTINGKEVSSGENIAVDNNGYLDIHVESETPADMGYSGLWTSSDNVVTKTENIGSEKTSADFKVKFTHNNYSGKMVIKNLGADSLQYINLKFKIDESKVIVKNGDNVIKDGQTLSFNYDISLNVSTKDGQKHDITYDGHWSNSCGESSGASGSNYTISTNIVIQDFIYYEDANGTMTIGAS